MTFTNRNGVLYVSINGIRKSTKLKYSIENIKKFKSYYADDEFHNKFNITKKCFFVLDLVNEYLKEKEKDLKRNSLNTYLSLYSSRIKPYFENKYITDVKPIDVYNWYKTFTDKSTLNICNSILKASFEKAILKGYISNSPFIIKPPSIKNYYEINPFSYDEAKKIINISQPPYKNLFAVLFYTGMRTGEALGLKWENINFQDFTITIDSQFTNGFEDTPKTKSSIRCIDMINQCELFLKQQFKITGSFKYVFLDNENKPFKSSSYFYTYWASILEKVNIDYRSIYHTRHSFASNMLSNGENALWVSQMLGHKSLNITLEKYSRFIKKIGVRKLTYLD